jgi:hypothetical protein
VDIAAVLGALEEAISLLEKVMAAVEMVVLATT